MMTPRSRVNYDDFNDVTPILGKGVSGDPNYMPVKLLRNKCNVIYRIVLISQRPDIGHVAALPVLPIKLPQLPLFRQDGKVEEPLRNPSSIFLFC